MEADFGFLVFISQSASFVSQGESGAWGQATPIQGQGNRIVKSLTT